VATGDSGREAYTAIAWGVGLSRERSDKGVMRRAANARYWGMSGLISDII
jgi:hypothetical protein